MRYPLSISTLYILTSPEFVDNSLRKVLTSNSVLPLNLNARIFKRAVQSPFNIPRSKFNPELWIDIKMDIKVWI